MDIEEITEKLNEWLRQYYKKIESIVEIDKDKLKIVKFNGKFNSEIKRIRDLFSIPKLIKDNDYRVDFYVDKNKNSYPYERSEWKDSLSVEDKNKFHKEIIKSIKLLDFSYSLSSWFKKCVLYKKNIEFSARDYIFSGGDIFLELEKEDKINTSEKKLSKDFINFFSKKKFISQKEKEELLRKIKNHPVRKERRKRKVNEVLFLMNEHGREVENFSYHAMNEVNYNHKKTYGDIVIDLFDCDDKDIKSEKERLKKLKYRYKNKFKK